MSALQDRGNDDKLVKKGKSFWVEFEVDHVVGITEDGNMRRRGVLEDLFVREEERRQSVCCENIGRREGAKTTHEDAPVLFSKSIRVALIVQGTAAG